MARSIVSIDPGLNCTGAAIWNDSVLNRVLLLRQVYKKDATIEDRIEFILYKLYNIINPTSIVAIEFPQIYFGVQKMKGQDNNDLLPLAAIAGGMIGRYNTILIKPNDWKGQVPKHICQERITQKLHLKEASLIDEIRPISLLHNAIDAVGIGLFYLGRAKRGMA